MTVPSAQRIVAVPSTLIVSGRCRYLGYSATATAAASASIILYDDIRATASQAIDYIAYEAIQTAHQWYGPQGIACEAGIYVGALTGAMSVVIYYIPQVMLGAGVLMDVSQDQRVIHRFVTETEIDDALHGRVA